jgi:hypothetical protein
MKLLRKKVFRIWIVSEVGKDRCISRQDAKVREGAKKNFAYLGLNIVARNTNVGCWVRDICQYLIHNDLIGKEPSFLSFTRCQFGSFETGLAISLRYLAVLF